MAKQVIPISDGIAYSPSIGKALSVKYLKCGLNFSAAAESFGINPRIARGWLAKHPDFAELIADADATATDTVKASLYELAQSNPTAMKLFLDIYGGVKQEQGKPQARQADPMNAKESIKTLKGLLEKEVGNPSSSDF